MNDELLSYPELRSDPTAAAAGESAEDRHRADPAAYQDRLRGSSSDTRDTTTDGYHSATTTNPASPQPPAPGVVDPTVFYYHHTPDPAPSTSSSSSTASTNTVLVAVLIALIFLFVGILVYLLIPLVAERLQAKLASSQRRIQRRYETIEGWLISKKVRAHCPTCAQLQQQYKINHANNSNATTTKAPAKEVTSPKAAAATDPNRKVQLSPSYDTAETEPMPDFDDDDEYYFQHHHECPICYEALAAGDIVSWSPQNGPSCSHVFHHECIKEWLLHHDTCPCCRITFLPIDQPLHNNNDDDHKSSAHWGSVSAQRKRQVGNWVEQRSQRLKTTYYCLQEGFVTLDRAVPKDGDAAKQKSRRFVGSGISPTVLAQLRQSRSSSLTAVIATTPSSTTPEAATGILREEQSPHHRLRSNNNTNNHPAAPATTNSPRMHQSSFTSTSPTMVMLMNRCHSAPSSTKSTAAPQPMWTSRPDGSWVGTVDLDLSLQQLRVLDGFQGLSLRSSSSSSVDEEDDDDDELYLESPSTASGGGSSSIVSSASTLAHQPLHMSHMVVGDIELCRMKQQQQQENHGPHPRPVDWESASF